MELLLYCGVVAYYQYFVWDYVVYVQKVVKILDIFVVNAEIKLESVYHKFVDISSYFNLHLKYEIILSYLLSYNAQIMKVAYNFLDQE